MRKSIFIQSAALLVTAVLVLSCSPSRPSAYRGLPATYSVAYEQAHGHCYDSIAQAVVSLDLYSNGLELNSENRIHGTGYNLCFSDIFVPDSLLAEGEYTYIRPDSLACPDYRISAFSFLPGMDFEGYPHGAYILNIEEDQIKYIQLLDSGSFVYRNDSLIFTLYYKNTYGYKSTYRCSFSGALSPWQSK